jgi:hypothetical protein
MTSKVAVRNELMSNVSIAMGKESSTVNCAAPGNAVTNTTVTTYETSTNVSATINYTSGGLDTAGMIACRQTTWNTILFLNTGQNANTPSSIKINGGGSTTVNSNTHMMESGVYTSSPTYISWILKEYNDSLDNIDSIKANYYKDNDVNGNKQEMFVIPGRWYVATQIGDNIWNAGAGTTGTNTRNITLLEDDLVFLQTFRETGQMYFRNGHFYDQWTLGAAGIADYFSRSDNNNPWSMLKIFFSRGSQTLTWSTNSDSVDVDSSAYRPKFALVLRNSEV